MVAAHGVQGDVESQALFVLARSDFFTPIKAVGAHVMPQMYLSGGRLRRQGRFPQGIVGAPRAAPGTRFPVLLYCHPGLLSMFRRHPWPAEFRLRNAYSNVALARSPTNFEIFCLQHRQLASGSAPAGAGFQRRQDGEGSIRVLADNRFHGPGVVRRPAFSRCMKRRSRQGEYEFIFHQRRQ